MKPEEFAKMQGYTGAKFLHVWNGYKCYKPINPDDDGMIGLPLVILEKGGVCRISTPDEALQHFDDMGWTD